jgi:hypothetical protein
VIGVLGYAWDIKQTGVQIIFSPETVTTDTKVACNAFTKPSIMPPLQPVEALVSRVVSLEADYSKVKKEITLIIPHSGPTHTEGYEVVVKEFSEQSGTWKEVEDFTNIQRKSGRYIYKMIIVALRHVGLK